MVLCYGSPSNLPQLSNKKRRKALFFFLASNTQSNGLIYPTSLHSWDCLQECKAECCFWAATPLHPEHVSFQSMTEALPCALLWLLLKRDCSEDKSMSPLWIQKSLFLIFSLALSYTYSSVTLRQVRTESGLQCYLSTNRSNHSRDPTKLEQEIAILFNSVSCFCLKTELFFPWNRSLLYLRLEFILG